MDDQNKNLILATVLSFVVILVWYTVFAPVPPVVDPTAQVPGVSQTAADAVSSTTSTTPPVAPATNADVTTVPAPADAPRLAIDTPRLSGSISLLGGTFDDLSLKDYRETLDPSSAHVRLLTAGAATNGAEVKPYFANYGWLAGAGLDAKTLPTSATLWSVESGTTLSPTTPVTIKWDNGAGLIFRREIEVDANFMFTVTQSVENRTAAAVKLAPYGIVLRQSAPKSLATYVLHEGVVRMADGKLREVTYKKLPGLDPHPTEGPAEVLDVATGGWVGFTDKYWMTTMVPMPGQPFKSVIKYVPDRDLFVTSARMPEMEVAPGATASNTTMLFAGAKEWDAINAYQNNPGGLDRLFGAKVDTSRPTIDRFVDSIDWGWYFVLTKPMFRLLHWLHGMIGNMGWAIIALTFVIKTLVFPLARKSYVAMAKMKELQPEMEALKERTGGDRQKMQAEMMALYKREKVNPASGCLPILIQIPIFFALYKVIFVTLELRHAPWLGWIRDLSAPDPSSILNLFGLLPWATPEPGSLFFILSLGVLPILLGISMWFQQKLNPAPTDATQAAIFAWMPWIFMFMLGSFASGLVLYWITNNTITFLQQYTIMSMHGKRPDLFGNIKSGFKREKPAEK